MTTTVHRYLRFAVSDRILHGLLLGAFTVLALTGLPQKWADAGWAVAMIRAMGGIEQTRVIHHTAAVVLIVTSIAHAVQVGYRIYVQRKPLTMLPTLRDVADFVDSVKYNVGLSKRRPAYPRFNFIEKLEYWAVVWGTILMTITGYVLWNPVLITTYLPGEVVPAAKIAHGMEAILAVLSILTWHFYFVHLARFNKSMFNGYLTAEEMEEEHALELEQRLAGRVWRPPTPEVRYYRLRLYVPLATLFVIVSLLGTWRWLTAEATAITTVPRTAVEQKIYQPVGLRPLPTAAPGTPLPTPPRVLAVTLPQATQPATTAAGPPPVPHEVTGDKAQCNVCHAVDSALRPAPAGHEAFTETQCLTCHTVGVAGAVGAAPAEGSAAAPAVPHAIDGDWAQCATCHAVGGGMKPMPASHQAFTPEQCLTCHQAQTAAGETPAAGAAPPVAAPPIVPHQITGDWAQCTLCHAVGSGMKPMPTSHEAFAVEQCLTCHQTGGGQ